MRINERSTRGLSVLSLLAPASATLYDQTIQLSQGKVQGAAAFNESSAPSYITNWKDIAFWKGIPYAATTGGENRWKPPQSAPSWNGTLKATSFGPSCPSLSAGDGVSEDCLSINIWSPATATDAKLPVMLWSYATGGESSQSTYDGAGMAAKDVIFVSYNYRTGPLGWLTLHELAEETGATGNYGLLDQIEALKWVYENIAAFGGEPESITVAGQSFGSGAAYHLVNSPRTKGMIKGAIAESGLKDPYDPDLWGYGSDYRNMTWAYAFSKTYAESLNATSVADLRSMDLETVLSGAGVSDFTGFDPVLNYHAIPNKYIVSLDEGAPNDVPILVGNNEDEDGIDLSKTYTVAEYKSEINSTYGPYAAELLALHPAENTTQATAAYNSILRAGYCTSTWSWAKRWNQSSTEPVYYYLWTYSPPGSDGATHGSEVSYALNNLYAQTTTSYTDTDYEVANIMSSYWANFVKTQNPNKGDSYNNGTLPYWGSNVPAQQNTFELGSLWKKIAFATAKEIQLYLEYFKYATPSPY
ncbi:carboxylesterase [Aspergillus costaricaensis CBS 115574]|uniref:Carboxylesterase n=1 Tax=Aspergillus costaricaensis CBS 115574 TaxID=1448317 RepID=A0ACD1IGM9_9EURO|nr:carboxylesterase [Aspergillus costaricaensis CBS 115574]RAK89654.1 carboxylesterase [Aspergillus costaricaensis CBS 115574]